DLVPVPAHARGGPGHARQLPERAGLVGDAGREDRAGLAALRRERFRQPHDRGERGVGRGRPLPPHRGRDRPEHPGRRLRPQAPHDALRDRGRPVLLGPAAVGRARVRRRLLTADGGPLERVRSYGRMIRFSHSVFALPFALTAAVLAGRDGITARQVFWIVVAMVGARSAPMGLNRLADQDDDARTPRTAARELPRGVLSRGEVFFFVALSALVLVLASAMLNPVCLALSPLALAIVFGYSYTKRFTSLSHLVLGLALGIAPVGAWLAVRGRFDLAPAVLAVAVLAWVAGFDTIYACQDVDFDRRQGLPSLPARP